MWSLDGCVFVYSKDSRDMLAAERLKERQRERERKVIAVKNSKCITQIDIAISQPMNLKYYDFERETNCNYRLKIKCDSFYTIFHLNFFDIE